MGEVEYPLLGWDVKAKGSTRRVPLSQEAVLALRRVQVSGGGSAYVFLDLARLRRLRGLLEGGYLPPKLVPVRVERFRKVQEAAGIEGRLGSVHDLRRTFCTQAAATLPMHVLQEYAGHTDIKTTAGYYCRTTVDDAAKLRKAMAG